MSTAGKYSVPHKGLIGSVIWLGVLLALFNTALAKGPFPANSTDPAALPPVITGSATPRRAVNDPLPRIQCVDGYTASIYAEGLSSPDGLAFSPAGRLFVAEETAGQVSRVETDGSVTPVLTGLNNPEGIAFDPGGNLYVVEDVPQNQFDPTMGRLIKMSPAGITTTLAANLDAPEGVVWHPNGNIYITESNVQFTFPNFLNYRSRVAAVSSSGTVTRILTSTLFWSYAGITRAGDGLLYITNEASGVGTDDSVFTVDPITGNRILFTSGLTATEGLRFSTNAQFPLYVAEEDIDGNQNGRLSQIESDGSYSPFCTGFSTIEDVVLDANGRIFVSEDSSGNGIIILIEPESTPGLAAKSLILFIGDGMGEVQRAAARWQAVGPNGLLAMDDMPYSSLARTNNISNTLTDSAAAGTALATGFKTINKMIGQAPNGNPLTTILEQARAKGMAVGLVSNTQMAHATPASFAAHVPLRSQMAEIAAQMLAAEVDVLLGGGEDDFLPTTQTGCYPNAGLRSDGRNLITEAVASGYTYVCTPAEFAAVNPTATTRLLGLFSDGGMVRPHTPSVAAMTQKSIDILSQNPNGFFLMVEGGQIDWASHQKDAANAITDTIDFDSAVAIGKTYSAANPNTLVIVTADHETGGMSLSLTSGEDGPFYMPDSTSFYVNWSTFDHTDVDTPTTAQGPCANLLTGAYENTFINSVMQAALSACFTLLLDGPAIGATQTPYTFTASIDPISTTLPITFAWTAAGQTPITGANSVAFTWDTTGAKTVTVTAQSSVGSISASHRITVSIPLSGVTITGPATGTLNVPYTAFTAEIIPITATAPITYHWSPEPDGGQNTSLVTYTWAATGSHTITVTAANPVSAVTDTHIITISQPSSPPPDPIIYTQSPSYLAGSTAIVILEYHIPNTTFAIYVDGQYIGNVTTDANGLGAIQYLIPPDWMSGSYVIESQLGGVPIAFGMLFVTANGTIVPPITVTVSSPTTGTTGIAYTFTAAIEPGTTTIPVTYVWQATNQPPLTRTAALSDSVSYTWDVTGTQLISVTALNVAGSDFTTHTIQISTPASGTVILPPLTVTITGPITGSVNNAYTFTAEVEPGTATFPITYFWQTTNQLPITHAVTLSSAVVYTWTVTGTQHISIAISNPATEWAGAHTIEIDSLPPISPPPKMIYLLLILKQ